VLESVALSNQASSGRHAMTRRMAVELDLILPESVNTHTLLHALEMAVHGLDGGTLSAWAGCGGVPDDPKEAAAK
jgi:hypothetical protein